jgi:hypothetical protein
MVKCGATAPAGKRDVAALRATRLRGSHVALVGGAFMVADQATSGRVAS